MWQVFTFSVICTTTNTISLHHTCKNVLCTRSYGIYSHRCNKFLHARTFFTLADTTFIPMGVMDLHARMFCRLSHTSSTPMGAIYFYMQERFLHSLIPLLFPCLQCIYMQECSVHLLVSLLFPWVQCQSLKPVLSQCSQTGFVTVDDFIALYTCSYVFYSHGCNKFLHARTFFTFADTITPIFTVITEVWPRANRAVVTNNSSVIIEVLLIKAVLIEGFLYLIFIKLFLLSVLLFWCPSYYAGLPEQCYSRLHFVISTCVWMSSWMLKSFCSERRIFINIYTNYLFRFYEKVFAHFQCKILIFGYCSMLIKILSRQSSHAPYGFL